MFGSVRDTGHQNSVVSAPVLIPKVFIWPHGGRRVFLSGSFTRWSEHIPMSPIEGCPTAFQVLCSLTPGYHQYKFNVDGEWRHDEQQPFANGDFGIVNTIFLAMEPGVFMHLESIPRIPVADLDVSRQRVSTFLSKHTAYELVPDSGKVMALDVNLPVKQAFHLFYEQGVSTAPLWDSCKSQFVGVLSALDFILIMRELGNHGSKLTEEQLETHTIAAWKEGKIRHHKAIDGSVGSYPQNFIHAGSNDCLKDVVLKILQTKVATVPVIGTSQDGSNSWLLYLASLSDILKCICRHFKHSAGSLPILQLPISSLPFGTWMPKVGESNGQPLAMIRPNTSLGAALSLLVQAEVSSVPILDDNGSLLDIYSRSDITALAKDKAYTQICLDEISIHQALLLGYDATSLYGVFNGQRCHMCLRTDPLHKVMEQLADPGVRRLVIVEAGSKRVEGIISLSDVFKLLLG